MPCSPSLVRLMAAFADRGHVNSGCVGDQAHAARKSDHNPDASGYAHAQDIHEKLDHDMQPYVDFIMANPGLFPQVKYMIYEGFIYYPNDGARPAGKYTYTGPNAHAGHLHVSIHADATHYAGSWYVAEAYSAEEDDMFDTPDRHKLNQVHEWLGLALLPAVGRLEKAVEVVRDLVDDPAVVDVDVDVLAEKLRGGLGDEVAAALAERLAA